MVSPTSLLQGCSGGTGPAHSALASTYAARGVSKQYRLALDGLALDGLDSNWTDEGLQIFPKWRV